MQLIVRNAKSLLCSLVAQLSFATIGYGADISHCNNGTTVENSFCVDAAQQQVDAKLEKVFALALQVANGDENTNGDPMRQAGRTIVHDALVQSQAGWIQFRKADCEAIFLSVWGSIRNQARSECMIEHAETRIHDLETHWTNRRPE